MPNKHDTLVGRSSIVISNKEEKGAISMSSTTDRRAISIKITQLFY
jgi:hypothetical protein